MQSPAGAGPPHGQQPEGQQQPQQWVMMQQTGMQPQSHEEVKTLWVGDLQYWMDENYLHTAFVHTGEVPFRTPFLGPQRRSRIVGFPWIGCCRVMGGVGGVGVMDYIGRVLLRT